MPDSATPDPLDDLESIQRLKNPGKWGDMKPPTAERLLSKDDSALTAEYRRQAPDNFLLFALGLDVVTQTGPQMLTRVAALFQRDFFEAIAPSLDALRRGDKPPCQRWWMERTKKASKDADLAIIMLWLIAFPLRPFFLQVGAGNREQAAIVKQRITHLLHWNPWLNEHVEVIQSTVRSKTKARDGSPMAHLQIMSSDQYGAHGGTPDLLVINELSHIVKWEFAETLMDNADGVPYGMAIIATNAGFTGSSAWKWRNAAIASESWEVRAWSKPAPWHSKAHLEDAKARCTHSRYQRLWKGKWVSGRGDALSEDTLDACFQMEGPDMDPLPGWVYLMGLDLGVKHDHAGLVVTGINTETQIARTARWRYWKPPGGGEIDLSDVEGAVLAIYRRYRVLCCLYDPDQAKLMAQRLTRMGCRMRELNFTPANLTAMAISFVQLVDGGKLHCYDDDDGYLRNDLSKLHIAEKPYGYRLEATSDSSGHADVATALVITCPSVVDLLDNRSVRAEVNGPLIADSFDLTDDELQAMPAELREIYDMDEGQPVSRGNGAGGNAHNDFLDFDPDVYR